MDEAYGAFSQVAASTAANGMMGCGMSGQRSGGFGTVESVTSTSVTVSEMRQGTTKTYAITSSTKILNATAAGTIADIASGDRIMVETASSTSTDATQITVNPTTPGGAPDGTAGTSSSANTN